MLTTAEVRWFSRGEWSADVVAWFDGLGAPVWEEGSRLDRYLLVRETDSVGIKFREGRVEIKQREGSVCPLRLGQDVVGCCEQWTKWGFELATGTQAGEIHEDLTDWEAVRKARLVRSYAVRRDGTVVALPAPPMQGWSCSVELTRVTAFDEVWWTLGFEAMGDPAALKMILTSVARHVLAETDALSLGIDRSYGYPRWLLFLAEGSA